MRLAITILFTLISMSVFGQAIIPFANGRATDTAQTIGLMKLPYYKVSDSNKILGISATGVITLRTKVNGIGLQQLADSVALRELSSNKVTSFASPNNTTYPTTSAVNGLLSSYVTKVFLYDTIKTKQDTGVVMPIRLGGTGATTAQAALNALAVPTGNSGKILGSNGENVIYTTFPTSVGRVYSPDSSITISPISGSDTLVALSLNLARRNTWTVPQVFTNIDADTVRGKVSLADVYPTPVTNVDSGVYSTKAYRLKGDDSVAKLGIDSAGVLRTLANSKLSLSDTNIIATKLLLQKKVDSLNIVSATKLSLSDTGTIATRARVQKAVDSLNALIALKQNILTAGRFITLTSNIVSVSASGTPSSTTFLRGDSTWAVPSGGSGSVTSVAATVPTDFSISGSPITSTGTLAITHKGLNTITDGANFVFDGSNGNFQKITLGASRTFTITNLLVGVIYKFYVVQDGTGTRILTWGTTVKAGWGYTTTPPISTAANTTDIYEMTTDGTNIFVDVQLGH